MDKPHMITIQTIQYNTHLNNMCISSDVMSNYDISNIIFDFHGKDSYMYSSLSKTHVKMFNSRGKKTSLHHVGESVSRLDDLEEWDTFSIEMILSIFNACARKGSVNSMRVIAGWYRSRGMNIPIQMGTMERAVRSEDIDTMSWCERYGCRLTKDVMYTGVCTKNTDVVGWLVSKRCPYSGQSFEKAAEMGNIQMLKYFIMSSFYSSKTGSKSIEYAGRNGHIETIKFLLSYGFPIGDAAPGLASLGGHIEVLEFFYERGYCQMDNTAVCYMAAMNGHLELLKRAREMGFQWDSLTTRMAKNRKHLDVLEYAIKNGCPQE